MPDNFQKLVIVKTLHTIIWLGFNLILAYLYYAVFTRNINHFFWLGIGAIALECFVLLLFKWKCPLTYVAENYSSSRAPNFDIYLPQWLAKHNKLIYSVVFGTLIIFYIFRIVIN